MNEEKYKAYKNLFGLNQLSESQRKATFQRKHHNTKIKLKKHGVPWKK